MLQPDCNSPSPPNASHPRVASSYVIASTLFLVGVAFIFWQSPNFRTLDRTQLSPFGGDFLQEWVGGHLVREGIRGRFYDPNVASAYEHNPQLVGFAWDENQYLPMVYPPFYYLIVSPLAAIPFRTACAVWSILLVLGYIGGMGVLYGNESIRQREFALGNEGGMARLAWLLPMSLLFTPLIESLCSGQKGTLLFSLMALSYVLQARGRPFSAGLAAGCLVFKPHFALIVGIAMLLTRRWRTAAGMIVMGLVGVLLCIPVGWEVMSAYIDFSLHTADYLATAGYDLSKSHSLMGLSAMLTGSSGWESRCCTAVLFALAIAAIVRLLVYGRSEGRNDIAQESNFGELRLARLDIEWTVMCLACILLSPHLYTYDLTILLLPFFLVIARACRTNSVRDRHLATGAAGLFIAIGASPGLTATIGFQASTVLFLGVLWYLAIRANVVNLERRNSRAAWGQNLA